jgi:hypothetical protein
MAISTLLENRIYPCRGECIVDRRLPRRQCYSKKEAENMMETLADVSDLAFKSGLDLSVPQNMGIAHRAALYELWDVMGMGGIGGDVARDLAARLSSHFRREEELMDVIFSLEGPPRSGAPEPEDIAVMISFLESELGDLRAEHGELRPKIGELMEIAEASYDQGLYDLARSLEAHLDAEEAVHFPVALYVGRRFLDDNGMR